MALNLCTPLAEKAQNNKSEFDERKGVISRLTEEK